MIIQEQYGTRYMIEPKKKKKNLRKRKHREDAILLGKREMSGG